MLRRQQRPYRPGQRPAWLDEAAAAESVEAKVEEADVNVAVVENDVEERKPARPGRSSKIQVKVAEPHLDSEKKSEVRRRERAIITDGLEVPEAVIEVDEEVDAEERRRRARQKMVQAESEAIEVPVESIQEIEQLEEQQEGEEFTESEEETEEESESDHDHDYGRVLMKPVFVSKADRDTAHDKYKVQETVVNQRDDELLKQERKKEVTEQLINAIQREETDRELAAKAAQMEIPDDTDLPDDSVEYEKWRLREMVRILRDREERRLADEERAETERRRQLSDETIMKEIEEKQAAAPEKTKIKFLQRYHHKGVFYTDSVDPELLQRDHNVATGFDAEVDRSVLPKVLQVKNFGLSSRTKYTHLTDQDTSRDNPWSESEPLRPGRGSKHNYGDDRYIKRPRNE